MSRYNAGVTVAVATATMTAIEIGFHWLLRQHPSSALSGIYLPSNYTSSRDDFAGFVDSLGPAAVLGLASGWVAFPRWSLRKLTLVGVGLGILVAALEPLYWAIIGWHRYNGVHAPKNLGQAVALLPLSDCLTACLVCLFFANIVYRGRRELARGKSKTLSERQKGTT